MPMKLMTTAKITALITKAVATTQLGLVMIHTAAVQTMMHAEEHGDVTLCARLMQEVKDNCKGVVVAGLADWFKKYSPVKLIVEEGKVKGTMLKPGEPGYKAFNVQEAEANPAMESKEVGDRANRPIEPFSIALVKKMIRGFESKLDKAIKEGNREIVGDPELIRTFIKGVVKAADKVEVLKPKTTTTEAPNDVKQPEPVKQVA